MRFRPRMFWEVKGAGELSTWVKFLVGSQGLAIHRDDADLSGLD